MISGLKKFTRLTGAERCTLIEAVTVCSVTKLLLATMPYRVVDSLAARSARSGRDVSFESDREQIDGLIRAVTSAAMFVPGANNCLVRAISAKVILARRGFSTEVRFGVEKPERGTLDAHAWLEGGGHVLIGAFDPGRYTPLMPVRENR